MSGGNDTWEVVERAERGTKNEQMECRGGHGFTENQDTEKLIYYLF